MTRQHRGTALLGLAAAWLAAGCGAGVAAVVASSGSSGGGSSAPAIVNLSLTQTKRSPARIEFELQNAGASVELRYHRPGDPPDTFTRMEHFSGLAANPITLAQGSHDVDWDFSAEVGIDRTGRFEPEVAIEVAVVGQPTGFQRIAGGVGNDLPRITSAAADVDPVAGEVSGIVLVEAMLEDTPGDRANLKVEFSLDGTSWQLARPAQDDATPEFAFTNVVAEEGGTSVPFFWDTADDLGDADTDALIRFVPFEDVEGMPEQGTMLASAPFHLDNNAAPIVQIFNDLVVTNPDERRGIPVPFRVIDEEADLVDVIFQWRREGEGFPELLESELDAILADPVRRREKHICTEYPRFASGRVIPIDATHVRLPELALGSESWILASGLEGKTLELLRSSSIPEPITPSWSSNPLVSPVAALPLGDGLTALVLDGTGPARLREIELATGVIVREIATLGPGIPSAMAAEVLPGSDLLRPAAVLVALDDAGTWRIQRVDLASGAVTEIVTSDGTEPAPVRGIASLGRSAAVFTAGSGLLFLDYRDPLAPQLSALLSDLATPHGVVVDPLATNRLYLAERDAVGPNESGRILAIGLDGHGSLPVVVKTADMMPATLDHPTALALEQDGSRLLIVTNAPAGATKLVGLDLGAEGANVSFSIGVPLASGIASLSTGPDGLRVVTLPASDELLVGGGMEQRRMIEAHESSGQLVTVNGSFNPEVRPGSTWQIANGGRVHASAEGIEHRFLWSSSADLPAGGRALLRALPMDDELGATAEGAAPKNVRAPLDVTPLAVGGPPVMDFPFSVAVGDLDGDGDQDLVSANVGSSNLTVFFQEAPGAFGLAPLSLGGLPTTNGLGFVTLADLDGDGYQDLVSANESGDNLTVFFQTSPGTFATTPLTVGGFPITDNPRSVAVGDLNGDGDLDLVSADSSLSIFLQSTPGSFVANPIALGRSASSVAVGDLDGDGDLDLVSQSFSKLTVFFQQSPGSFGSPPVDLDAPPFPERVAVGDLDGDGDHDLASANISSLTVFFQQSPGSFWVPPIKIEGPGLDSVAVGDLDGDGRQDLVSGDALGFGGSNTLTVFFQETPGSFGMFALGPQVNSFSVALGDLDGDGDQDLVSADGFDLKLFFQESPGTFGSPPLALGGFETKVVIQPPPQVFVALGDLDGDGDQDLVSKGEESNTIRLFFQDLPGAFGSPPLTLGGLPSTVSPLSVALGDLDGDGDQDIVMANAGSDRLAVFFLETSGSFGSPLVIGSVATTKGPVAVALGDLDGDGDQDIVSANCGNDTVTVFFQETPGSFRSPPLVLSGFGDCPVSIALGDLDEDGDRDIAVANVDGDSLTVYFQETPGSFRSPPLVLGGLPIIDRPRSVALGDLDGDGDQDIVSANTGSDNVTIFFQKLPGTFPLRPLVLGGFPTTDGPRSVALGDFDGDGDLDLVSANEGAQVFPPVRDNLTVFFQEAPGTFRSPPLVLDPVGFLPTSVATGDLDGDGDPEIVSANGFAGILSVFWGGN